jgi:hypothetical protein
MKHFFLLFFISTTICFKGNSQNWNINLLADSISVTGVYTDNRSIIFSNKYTQYDTRYLKYGLHFRNNLVNEMNNPISINNLNDLINSTKEVLYSLLFLYQTFYKKDNSKPHYIYD